jgi:hypothetical protein
MDAITSVYLAGYQEALSVDIGTNCQDSNAVFQEAGIPNLAESGLLYWNLIELSVRAISTRRFFARLSALVPATRGLVLP